jgi:molecular chaperone GrpE
MKNKKTSQDYKNLENQMDVLKRQLEKAIADYRNLEGRIEKEAVRFRQNSVLQLIDKMLSVLDDLERAEINLKERGLTLAVNQFKEVLKSEGTEEILTDREKFDPVTMDCAEVVDGPKDVVVETILKGYRHNGEVIRPAKVKVGKGKN